jgi:hypothetical protein
MVRAEAAIRLSNYRRSAADTGAVKATLIAGAFGYAEDGVAAPATSITSSS